MKKSESINLTSSISYLLLLILSYSLATLAVAESDLDPQKNSQGKMGALTIERWTTSQGMQVLFAESHEIPMIDIRLVFDAGAARDQYEISGVAKLTNRLIFEGSKQISANNVAKTFEQLGSQYSNGSYRDMAVLSFRSLSEKQILTKTLDTIMAILEQPLFDQNSLKREINKLKISLKRSQESPSAIASLAFFKALYDYSNQARHPYANQTKGTLASLSAIKRSHLINFFNQYYVAKNAVLAIVGDVSLSKAKDMAEKLASTLKSGEHAKALPEVRDNVFKQTFKIKHKSEQTAILMGQAVIKRGDPDYYPLYVGNHILGGSGFSSRLVKDIRVKHGLTYSVGSYFAQMREKGPFQISLTTKTKSAQQAVQLVNKNLQEFINNGPTEEELTEAQLNISGSFPLLTSSNQQIGEHLSVIGFYNLPINYLDIFKEKVAQVTQEDIQDAFKDRVEEGKMITIMVGSIPKKD